MRNSPRSSRALVGLLCLAWGLGLIWFWAYPALPFQDLVAHAGFLATRLRYAASPVEQAMLVYAPRLGPYSLFHLLGALASLVWSPLGTMRLIASLVWTAYPAALVYARFRLTGRLSLAHAFAGMLLALGLMTMLGLASFQLAAALLLVVHAEWLALVRAAAPSKRRVLGFSLLPLVLFFAHGFAFVLFLLLAAITLVAPALRRHVIALLGLVPGVVACVAAGLARLGTSVGMHHEIRFQSLGDKLALLVTPTLLTRFGLDVAVGLGLWVWAGHHAVHGVRTGGMPRLLALQAMLLLGAFFLLPHAIGPFGFVDARLLPTALALALLAGPEPGRTLTRAVAFGTFVLLGCALFASTRFQREAEGSTRIAARIPAGARLLHLPLDPDSRVFAAHPFLHYDKLALIERPLVVSDVWFHEATALYPRSDHPALHLPKTARYSVLGEARWSEYQLEDWDYVLCRTQLDDAEPAAVPAQLSLLDHAGGFWLYRVNEAE